VFWLDSFDFSYAQQLAMRGLLPWFSAQLEQGSVVTTHGSALAGAEMVNAMCGVSAARHGYLHVTQLRAGTYEELETDARVVRTDPFYVPLIQAGAKGFVVDLPGDLPRPHKHLAQVIEWGREFNLWPYATTPGGLKKRVHKWCGAHPLTNYGHTVPDEPTLLALREKLLHGTHMKGKLVRELMRQDPEWQFALAGFSEVHKGGHFFWQYQDPNHPNYAGAEHPLAGALVELYRVLDAECASICEAAGEDVNLLIASDRGMGPNFRGDHLVEPVLERLGWYTAASGARADVRHQTDDAYGSRSPGASGLASLARRLKGQLPVAVRPLIRRLAGRERANWAKTSVFQIADVGASHLRVNLIGREPRGTIAPGRDYELLLSLIEQEFKALIDPVTGRSPIAEIVFPQREFAGPLQAELPDVGIVWGAEAPVAMLESPSIGRIEGVRWEQRSGNHTIGGGLLAAGPNFKIGRGRCGDLRELAPTLLALHGVSAPDHYEFGPMAELR
jgi:predicted AlkP superfamily phosphohydrolase/phosphomutase